MARASRSRGVLEILEEIGEWEPFVGPTGVQLYRIPSGSRAGRYTVGPTSCTCPQDQYRRRDQLCKHRRAVQIALKIHQTLNQKEETYGQPDLHHAGPGDAGPDARPACRSADPSGQRQRTTAHQGPH